MQKIFLHFFNGNNFFKYEVMKYIKDNIFDEASRYLLVIAKASLSPYLIRLILKQYKKEYSFYLGSQFKEDLNQEFYSLKILNKIQYSMEQEKVLVLKNLESIYPSLYDLFNQNFTVVGEKSFARIALGSSDNLMSYVNDKFRCVILLDQSEIDKQDPPFLNRFEKHIISFEKLLEQRHLELSQEISNYLKDLVIARNEKLQIKLDLSKE